MSGHLHLFLFLVVSRELMQLIHEHLLGSGFTATAAMLQKEADLAPLPSTAAVTPVHQVAALET